MAINLDEVVQNVQVLSEELQVMRNDVDGMRIVYRRLLEIEELIKEMQCGGVKFQAKSRRREPLYAMKNWDRVGILSGDRDPFANWKWKLCCFLTPINGWLVKAMEWAEKSNTTADVDQIKLILGLDPEQQDQLKIDVDELYALLAIVTEGEAATSCVKSVAGQNGLEAWRLLNRRFGDVLPTNVLLDANKLMYPKQLRYMELEAGIAEWITLERKLVEADKNNELPELFRKEALLKMCPEKLSMELRTSGVSATTTFEQLRAKIELAIGAWKSNEALNAFQGGKKKEVNVVQDENWNDEWHDG